MSLNNVVQESPVVKDVLGTLSSFLADFIGGKIAGRLRHMRQRVKKIHRVVHASVLLCHPSTDKESQLNVHGPPMHVHVTSLLCISY